MFISEFEQKVNPWNAMREIYKNRDVKKTSLKIFSELFEMTGIINSDFSITCFLVCMLVGTQFL